MIAHQEDPGRIRAIVRQVQARRALAAATSALPVGEAGRALLGTGAPWYESWLEHPEHDDPYWAPLQLHQALERTQIPVLLLGGWQDLFLEQTLAQYRRLRERGVPVAVTIGPWTHAQMMTKGAPTVIRESLGWLDAHLAGTRSVTRKPVRIHVNGHGWEDLDDWPPAMPEQVLYLRPAGRLGATAPDQDAPASTFTYDPADPTPTIGGRLLSPEGGYRNDTQLAERADVLTLHRRPAAARTSTSSEPRSLELSHSCDNPLQRPVRPDQRGGRAGPLPQRQRRISLCAQRIHATCASNSTRSRTASRAGSRIRVLIAGGSHPRFARNLGTGEPLISGRRLAAATHTVHLGEGGTSRLVLPAGPRPPSTD